MCSRCQKTRVELARSRLESPARRRNSSAESPGPSNVMSVVQRALQPPLQPPMHPPLQSQLHSRLEMQSYRHLCLAKLCNLLETELRCPPSSQLGSQLRTRPRAHDRCLLTYPAIFSLNSFLQRQPFREGLRFMKDSESYATRRDLFDNFLYCIRSPLHVSRLHKYFRLPTCNTQARRMQRLDCNRDAVRLNYRQLERIHARARVDMSMLATGKMAFKVESGLIVRPYVCSNFFVTFG